MTLRVEVIDVEPGSGEITSRSPQQLFWRRFRRDRVATASLLFIAVLVFVAIAAPLIIKVFNLHPLNT
jgi:ABC-type antimicrobial peptide transport system permease subunit